MTCRKVLSDDKKIVIDRKFACDGEIKAMLAGFARIINVITLLGREFVIERWHIAFSESHHEYFRLHHFFNVDIMHHSFHRFVWLDVLHS